MGFEPEEIEAIVKALRADGSVMAADCIEWLQGLLDERDQFLVEHGMFSKYADSIRTKPNS